ncbi:hypothetical protein D1J36_004140 [Riemerella anatipestifer]|uniref:hypothetical protein n=1 Tax=Riemerella anatipestifer TaxID=34085 RepID=UPI0012AD257D|nr:hypothetical protein [Riemerella anatipestifer]USL96300.1 hypothetical protein D1J36_004140 [Riemerella anatipestifer]
MKTIKKEKKIVSSPSDLKVKLKSVAANIRDKQLFQTKIEAARRSLEGFNTLPI